MQKHTWTDLSFILYLTCKDSKMIFTSHAVRLYRNAGIWITSDIGSFLVDTPVLLTIDLLTHMGIMILNCTIERCLLSFVHKTYCSRFPPSSTVNPDSRFRYLLARNVVMPLRFSRKVQKFNRILHEANLSH